MDVFSETDLFWEKELLFFYSHTINYYIHTCVHKYQVQNKNKI